MLRWGRGGGEEDIYFSRLLWLCWPDCCPLPLHPSLLVGRRVEERERGARLEYWSNGGTMVCAYLITAVEVPLLLILATTLSPQAVRKNQIRKWCYMRIVGTITHSDHDRSQPFRGMSIQYSGWYIEKACH